MSERYPELLYLEEAYRKPPTQTYPYGWPEELPKNVTSTALTNAINAFAGQGRLVGFTVTNTKTASQFIMLFDAVATPADAAVPLIGFSVPSQNTLAVMFGPDGRWMYQGLTLTNSTTQGSKTIGAADCIFDVQYVPQVI